MRFSIRDLLWLTAFVAVGIVWLTDRNAMRRERADLAKREAELTSRAKMWEAEANRAEKGQVDTRESLTRLNFLLQNMGVTQSDLVLFDKSGKRKKLIVVDADAKK
jgi:hypothetical protein